MLGGRRKGKLLLLNQMNDIIYSIILFLQVSKEFFVLQGYWQ